jgi:hypothetical protein
VRQEFEATLKWLALLQQIVPTASRIGWLAVPGIEQPHVAAALQQNEDGAARALGLEVQRVVVRSANDLPPAFWRLAQDDVHAVVVPNTSLRWRAPGDGHRGAAITRTGRNARVLIGALRQLSVHERSAHHDV